MRPSDCDVKSVDEFKSDDDAKKSGYTVALEGPTAVIVNALDPPRKRELGLRLMNLEKAGLQVSDPDVHAAMKSRKEWRRYFSDRRRGGRRSS